MNKSRKRIAQDYARNAIVDGDTKAGRYEKKMAVKEAAGEGPKMYGAHKDKGAKMYGKDHGPKMTSDPKSYRSSIAQHWHKENLLTENPIARRAAGK